jgi:organic radical activating enzyme
MDLTYTGGKTYKVEKEMNWKDMLNILKIFGPSSFEFTGGEPLRYVGIESLLNSLPSWSITSNTVNSIDGINFKKCLLWTASYHPHISDKAKERFMSNLKRIQDYGVHTAVTMVATPDNMQTVLKDIEKFKELGHLTNIHPYYDDCNFDWSKYPKEQEVLMKNEFLRYGDRFFNYGSVHGCESCYAGKDYFVVAPDGYIFRCVTEMVFGAPSIETPSNTTHKCTRECIVCCDWHYGIRQGFSEIFAVNANKK